MRFIRLPAFLLLLLVFSYNPFYPQYSCASESFFDSNEADYIVVGIGTAGGLMAKKLSDSRKTSVIAIHNGENLTNDPLIKFSKNVVFTVPAILLGQPLPFDPSILPPSLRKELLDLLAKQAPLFPPLYITGQTTPQTFANDRNILWGIAIPEGGASSVNAGAFCKGTRELYAKWEEIAGPNWSVERIFHTYKRLERYHGKTHNSASHGHHGPLKVRMIPHPSLVSKKFTKAIIKATGYPYVVDYNDPNTPIGVSSHMQLTQRGHGGKYRVSSATAFLDDDVMTPDGFGVNGRKLRVHFNSTALRTIWDGDRAIGVEYFQNNKVKRVFAKKGVVVCAGLFSSPFLLHSGIGPQSQLQSLGIPVVVNNPNVGQGLADQPHIITLFSSRVEDAPENSNTIFAEIAWLPAPVGDDKTSRQIRIATVDTIPGLTLALVDLCQPKSRGSVSISSANPLVPPVIDLGALSNPDDLVLYRQAFAIYVKAINKQIHKIDPQYELIFPDPAILDDPVLLTEFIKDEIGCNQHFQSHCRMAPQDQGGVVDSRGRVYGTKNLFVADDSIVPLCMDGSPMASAYLIAENVARMLVEDDD